MTSTVVYLTRAYALNIQTQSHDAEVRELLAQKDALFEQKQALASQVFVVRVEGLGAKARVEQKQA